MQERLLFAAAALARVVMVVVAFGLALGSIGLASVRGFCPQVEDAGAPAGAVTTAGTVAPAGPVASVTVASVTVATIVEEPTGGPEIGPTGAPGDQQTPAGEQTPTDGEQTPTDGSDQSGPCPGGAPRCLPPMVSSILIVGDPACHDQAGGRLRRILVPSFVGSTVLLAGAWWLRPTRLQELIGSERVDRTT